MSNLRRNAAFARPRYAVAAVAVLAILFGAFFAFQVLGGQAANVPSPREQLDAVAQRAAVPLVVYSEFGFDSDSLWAANPDNPSDRTSIAQVAHAYSYGVIPALSPNGRSLAVAVLPEGERASTGENAHVLLIDVASGRSQVLTEGIDLSGPVWSPASDAIAVRRVTSTSGAFGKTEVLRVALDGSAASVMSANAQLFPIDFSPDGRDVYAARLSSSGTDISAVNASGRGARQIAHLSDGVARHWQLSPDGTRLAYVADGAGTPMTAWTIDLRSGEKREALPGRGEAQLSPQWEANGGLTVGLLEDGSDGPARLAADGRLRAVGRLPAATGFDVPLSWSPGSADLAVRGFSNPSLADAGASWVFVVGTDGARHKLSENSDVIVAGWLNVEVAP